MEKLMLELSEKDMHMILWAIAETRQKWLEVCHATEDEDVRAEYGMDMATLDTVNEDLTNKAVAAFGENVKNFSRGLL